MQTEYDFTPMNAAKAEHYEASIALRKTLLGYVREDLEGQEWRRGTYWYDTRVDSIHRHLGAIAELETLLYRLR